MKPKPPGHEIRIGIFDHTGPSLGGGTMVAAHIAGLLSELSRVDLIRDWTGFNLEQVAAAFSLNLARVHPRQFPHIWESFAIPSRYSFRQQLQRSRDLTAGYDLFLYAGHWIPPFCYAKHGLIYCHFPIDVPLDSQLLTIDKRWNRRHRLDRWARRKAYLLAWHACLTGYDHILANSTFTAGWVERRWRKRAGVLYPPVELNIEASEKMNRIVSIGRFVKDERCSKGQLEQVAAFRDFLGKVGQPWELWMIGTCYPQHDRTYLEAVQAAAQDLPVRFLINTEREKVLEALRVAKVFWHTAGLYETKTADPVFSEHFGIATVEAMRAGCVPVVLSSGGQREIIQHGVNGFLCTDIGELVTKTMQVAESSSLLMVMGREANARSMHFSGKVFDTRILELIEKTLRRRTRHRGIRALFNSLTAEPVSSLPTEQWPGSVPGNLPNLAEQEESHAAVSRRETR